MNDLKPEDWHDWLNHPATKAYLAHMHAEWGAGGVRFESSLNKFADSRDEDRIVLEQIRQIAVTRREILKLAKWPEEEIQRLRNLDRETVGSVSRRGSL